MDGLSGEIVLGFTQVTGAPSSACHRGRARICFSIACGVQGKVTRAHADMRREMHSGKFLAMECER